MRPETSLRLLCWSLIAIAALAVFGRLSPRRPDPGQLRRLLAACGSQHLPFDLPRRQVARVRSRVCLEQLT